MSARKAFVLAAVVGAGVLAAALAGAGVAARQGDGGMGDYSGPGTTLTFNVTNSGTTRWQYIVFVLPAGSSFVDGKTTSGPSAPCTVGAFVPGSDELECGGFAPAVPPDGHVTVTATVRAPLTPCGSPVQLWVNSTGTPPYTRAGDLTYSGSCGAPPTTKSCDQERGNVAAARAKLEALRVALEAADLKWAQLRREARRVHAEYERILKQYFEKYGYGAAAVGAVHDALDASLDAQRAADAAFNESATLSSALANRGEDLRRAEEALDKCERSGFRLTADRTDAGPVACGAERAGLAAAQGRALPLGQANKRLEATGLRTAELELRGAVAGQIKLIADPRVREAAPRLRAALGRLRSIESGFARAVKGLNKLAKSAQAAAANVVTAKAALAKCQASPSPASVTISEDDTWAYDPATGKGNICINVRTTPPQASVSAMLTGPGGFTASAPKSPLHADGTAQIRGPFTQAGDYTKTLIVYDAGGNQTATVTKPSRSQHRHRTAR